MGGSSSVGSALIGELLLRGNPILATSRDVSLLRDTNVSVTWVALDLASSESCDHFLQSLGGQSFSAIILLAGEMSPLVKNPGLMERDVKDYLATHVANYAWLIHGLAKHDRTGNTKILLLSSRAAVYGSHDYFYSSAKAAIQFLVKSLSKNRDLSARTLSLAPGLIEDSAMAQGFSPKEIGNHARRAGARLLRVSEVARYICDILNDSSVDWDGRVIEIGPRYE